MELKLERNSNCDGQMLNVTINDAGPPRLTGGVRLISAVPRLSFLLPLLPLGVSSNSVPLLPGFFAACVSSSDLSTIQPLVLSKNATQQQLWNELAPDN
jgi:hypothetical protein